MLTVCFWAHPQEAEGSMSFHQHGPGLRSMVAFTVSRSATLLQIMDCNIQAI